jgi:UDP-GlcNAc:undecaprenyl-phosphate/decaprenyl-phosphate GlcNAc-1-phosphate transferase
LNTFLTFGVIFFSTVLSLILAPIAIRLAPKLRLVDDPNREPHKVHLHLVPLVGGFVLVITVFCVSILTGTVTLPALSNRQPITAILISGFVVFAFGLWDDYKNLRPLWKFIGQLIACLLLIFFGVQVQIFPSDWLNIAITLFWMIGVTNAYNFVDSMDGLAIGLAGLASAFFLLITIESVQPQITLFSTVLLGASLGVFYNNAPPARLFLGDSGAQFLGFVLGALGIVYTPVGFTPQSSWYIPILRMGVPIFDTSLVVISRMRRRQPVYRAGRDHTYHRLVKMGFSSNRAVLTMHMAALLLGCLAFVAINLNPKLGNIIFGVVLIVGLACFFILDGYKSDAA